MCRDPRLSRMAAFLGSIGIEMRAGAIDVRTLFPGSLISGGSLVVDGANPRRTGRRAARGCALRARAARAPVSGRRVARSRDPGRGNHDDRLVLGHTAGTRLGAGGCLPRHRLQGRRHRPTSSIAPAAGFTSGSRSYRHWRWPSTNRMRVYVA